MLRFDDTGLASNEFRLLDPDCGAANPCRWSDVDAVLELGVGLFDWPVSGDVHDRSLTLPDVSISPEVYPLAGINPCMGTYVVPLPVPRSRVGKFAV